MKLIKSNIVKAVLVVAVVVSPVFLSSCNDMLDLEPQGTFTDSQLDSTSIDGLITSAYAGLECHFFGNNESFQGPITNWIFDVRSDDAYKGGGALSMESNIHDLEVSNLRSDNVCVRDKWRNNFYAISRVHKAMTAIEGTNVDNKESLLAELKTLRAYFYFDLIRIFKNIPYFDETVSDPSSVSPYQYSRDEIFGFIKTDLRDAYLALPETQDEAGRFNKYVAAAIMAKVCAFTASVNNSAADWQEVIAYSDYVIGSSQYELYPNFLDMSKVENDNRYESILAIQFAVTSDRAHYNYCNILNTTYSEGNLYGQGDDFFLGSQNLVNAFRTNEDGLPYLTGNSGDVTNDVNVSGEYQGNVDPRLDFTVGRIGFPFRGHIYNQNWCRAYDIYGEYSGKKGLLAPEDPNIQLGFSPWGASGLNFCLIRYADILLLKAEALIETNQDLDEACRLINQVRAKARRSIDPAYSPVDLDPMKASYAVEDYVPGVNCTWTQDYARRAVRMERRLELAMEGNRWFDLVRWGTVVDVVNNYMQNESSLRTYYQGSSIDSDEVYFPIPLEEVDNSNGGYDEPQQ